MKAFAILFALFLSSPVLIGQIAIAPEFGDGTAENPYQINTLENLYWLAAEDDEVSDPDIASRWSAHYMQTADIDAASTADWFDGAGWIPIGKFYGFPSAENVSFGGHYEGQGHEIQNLSINRDIDSGCGLFGYANSATIVNLIVSQANVQGGKNTGLIFGVVMGSTITDCFATGIVAGTNIVGGIAGLAYFGTAALERCSFSGTIQSVGPSTGALVGSRESGGIRNSFYNLAAVTINGSSQITIGALDPDNFTAWQNSGMNLNINDYLNLENGEYQINSASNFLSLMIWGQFSEYVFKLNADVDLAEFPNHYIPYFSGYLKGNGKKVSSFLLERNLSHLGLFGSVFRATIEHMSVSGSITSSGSRLGLLVGIGGDVNIIGCYGTGSISGEGSDVGGLIGVHQYGRIENCFSRVNVTGEDMVGGFVGSVWSTGRITNCYSTGYVNCQIYSGGFAGTTFGLTSILNCYWDVERSGHQTSPVAEGRTTAEMTYPYDANTYVDWSFSSIWAEDIGSSQNDGYPVLRWINQSFITPQAVAPMFGGGSEANPFQISTLENLLWISQDQNRFGYHYQQTSNIDASSTSRWYDGKGFIPIGRSIHPFTGSYNGSNYEIYGLAINRPDSSWVGLFGEAEYASFQNIKLTNLFVAGQYITGGLAGRMSQCFVEHCSINGIVSARGVVGGLIGSAYACSITNSRNLAAVRGLRVQGMSDSAVYIGGLVGLLETGTITSSYNHGSVTGLVRVGGLIGSLEFGTVSNSYSKADLFALGATASSFGGFIGFQSNSTIENCFFVGYLHDTSPWGFVGEFVGAENSFLNCYVDVDVSGGNSHPNFIFSRTSSEMTSPYATNTYENWDFDTIWAEDADHSVNSGYPYLQDNSTVSIEDAVVPIRKARIYGYPNPFKETATLEYFVPEFSSVTEIEVFNIRGQLVKCFTGMPEHKAGHYRIQWEGKDQTGRQLSSGIYIIRLKTDKLTTTARIILLK